MADADIDSLVEDFEFLDDWEARYRYVIELGKALPPLAEANRNASSKVEGCVSQVWLNCGYETRDGQTVLVFTGDSDAHIVRGLIAILFVICSGRPARDILATDINDTLRRIGLDAHLTPQRSNGLQAMVRRLREFATASLAETTKAE